MMHPKTFTYEGIEYDLTHVWAFDMNLTLPAYNDEKEKDVSFTFFMSNHCFSNEAPLGLSNGDDGFMLDHNGNPRVFCKTRHKLSLGLKEHIKNLPHRTCLFTSNKNWLSIEILMEDGKTEKYHIYFEVEKHKKRSGAVIIRITTAYIKNENEENIPKRGRGRGKSKFGTIIRKVLKGEKVQEPKDR